MFTIGQISKMFNIPISTLRYYDKEGLFPNIQRTSGIRKFSDTEIEALRVIDCLKSSGMEIKDIKYFMELCQQGPSTYPKRKEMFENRKKVLEAELQELEKHMAMIQFKCWYYDQAIKDGNEERINDMIPNHLPKEIQEIYNRSHDEAD